MEAIAKRFGNSFFVLLLLNYFINVTFAASVAKVKLNNQPEGKDSDDSDCYYDNDKKEWDCDELDIPVGAIVGIAISALILFIVIPILLCFCCACCCFRGRKQGTVHSTVYVAPPQPTTVQGATYSSYQPTGQGQMATQQQPYAPAAPPQSEQNYGSSSADIFTFGKTQQQPYPAAVPSQSYQFDAPPPYPISSTSQQSMPMPNSIGWTNTQS